jgi:hypothetical protein
VIGGILQAVEIPGFLANEAELFSTTVSSTEAMTEFVKAWAQLYQEEPVDPGDLFKLASFPDDEGKQTGEWKGLLDDLLGTGKERSRQTKLGTILSSYRDKVIAGYKIIKLSRVSGKTRYGLDLVEPVEPVEPFSPMVRAENHFFFANGHTEEKNKPLFDTEPSGKGSIGSTGSTPAPVKEWVI